MAHLYISDGLQDGDPIAVLTGAEARHAAGVSRLRVGENVSITNARGLMVTGAATVVGAERVEVNVVTSRHDSIPTPTISLAQALAKGDRDELAIQMATELGIDRVYPWSAARSISQWVGPKIVKGQERWTAIVREASKQAMRSYVPEMMPIVTTADLVRLAGSTQMLVLDPTGDEALTELPLTAADIVLVVGPEGGITPQELDALRAVGAHIVRLGPTVLRTSTAGAAAISVLNSRLGRWSGR